MTNASQQIVILIGHPDRDRSHYGYQLAEAYKKSAERSGHRVREIVLADLDFPLLRSYDDFYKQGTPDAIKPFQEAFAWADHWVIIFPLWLGGMPALLKGFLEQVLRPGFAFGGKDEPLPKPLLKGKSARVIVTMGMPSLAYRWFFRAHSLKSLKRNILHFCGIRPVRVSLIGQIENHDDKSRQKWLQRVQAMAAKAL